MINPIDLKIARVETFPVALPTLADFAVSGGSVARDGEPSIRVLVKVTADDGTFGWGEATPVDLNGRQFITSTYAGTTLQVANGEAQVPDRPELGVDADEAWMRAQHSVKAGA